MLANKFAAGIGSASKVQRIGVSAFGGYQQLAMVETRGHSLRMARNNSGGTFCKQSASFQPGQSSAMYKCNGFAVMSLGYQQQHGLSTGSSSMSKYSFEESVERVKGLKQEPTNEQKLQLYGEWREPLSL